MPELPEVETITRRLREVLPGKTITLIEVLREKSFRGDPALLAGQQVIAVDRRSKIITLSLSGGSFLIIHLKMTGQLIYVSKKQRIGGGHPTNDFVSALPSSHTRVVLTFADKTVLYFNDMRVFGWIRLVANEGRDLELAKLGPDIIDEAVTPEYFFAKLAKRSLPIKQAIMDNSVVAGVGNIYACDALHLAKINPARTANSLSKVEATRLLVAMKTVITLGIEKGGASIQNYKNVEGLTGSYQHIRRVYAREGEPCPVCGTKIERMKQGGRSTFFCPSCQI